MEASGGKIRFQVDANDLTRVDFWTIPEYKPVRTQFWRLHATANFDWLAILTITIALDAPPGRAKKAIQTTQYFIAVPQTLVF